MHFIAYFTLQGTLVMLNTLCKVEYHENHVIWTYLHGVESEVIMHSKCTYDKAHCIQD